MRAEAVSLNSVSLLVRAETVSLSSVSLHSSVSSTCERKGRIPWFCIIYLWEQRPYPLIPYHYLWEQRPYPLVLYHLLVRAEAVSFKSVSSTCESKVRILWYRIRACTCNSRSDSALPLTYHSSTYDLKTWAYDWMSCTFVKKEMMLCVGMCKWFKNYQQKNVNFLLRIVLCFNV